MIFIGSYSTNNMQEDTFKINLNEKSLDDSIQNKQIVRKHKSKLRKMVY